MPDPWAVVSTKPTSAAPPSPQTGDPWAVVSHQPTATEGGFDPKAAAERPIAYGYERAGNVLKEAGKDLLGAVGGMADMFSGSPVTAPLKLGAGMAQGHIQAYQDAKDAAKQGNIPKSMFKSVAAGVPIVGPMASDIYDDAEAGNNDRAVGKGISRIFQLTAPEVAPKAVSALADFIPKSVPRSILSKTIRPDAPIEFHAAEQSAIPKINAAAQDLGQPIKTANDAIAAIRQAKQNALLDAHEAAGPGKTMADLPPDKLALVKQDLNALDTLHEHIKTAQETAAENATNKPQPTRGEAAGQIFKGGAKVAAGAALDYVAPGLGHAAGAVGLLKGAPEIASGIKNLVAKRALTLENLDAAVQQTFGSVEPATRSGAIPADVQGKAPYQTVTGDLSVQHEGNIAPPRQPHGDASITPDEEPVPPEQTRPPYQPYAGDRTVNGTGPEPAPPIKQPLKAATPATQTAEVLKKSGVQQALKDAGVAAPSATVRQIRPGIEVGPTLKPRMDLTFYGDKTGEGASLMQLTRYNINELRAMAVQRGLDVAPGETHVQLIEKIHDDLSPQEIKEFSDAAAERGRFSPPARAKRGAQSQATVQPQAGTEEPPASASYSGPNRRTDLDLRAAIAEMKPEEQVKALYQSDKTELPNKRAFDWAEKTRGPAKAIGMSDADGLKALNDKYGYTAGDALLKAKADALQEAGLEAYHDKGDEFMFRGESSADLTQKLAQARELLRNRVIRFTGQDGKLHEFTGADFSSGVGDDLTSAEAGLKVNKASRKASGESGERGQMGNIREIKKK